jgi:hypothetical protein
MADAQYYPDLWRDYCRLIDLKSSPHRFFWNRFAARYRAAAAFQYAEFMRLSDKTGRGYSAAIKLLLSYSAFECACKASSVATNTTELSLEKRDLDWVVKRLIKVFAPKTIARENLVNSVTSARLRKKIEEFLSGGHVDLQPICAALRNMIAHGHWTPNGANSLTVECIEIYELLSYALLKKSDKLLESEVKKLG